MQGYFVLTKDADDDESKKLKSALAQSKLVNLKCTRTFNRVTDGQYQKAATSAVAHIRNRTEEQRAKRKEYHAREDVKTRTKEYNRLPEVKEKKRQERLRKKKLLERIPKELIEQVYKEEEEAKKSSE